MNERSQSKGTFSGGSEFGTEIPVPLSLHPMNPSHMFGFNGPNLHARDAGSRLARAAALSQELSPSRRKGAGTSMRNLYGEEDAGGRGAFDRTNARAAAQAAYAQKLSEQLAEKRQTQHQYEEKRQRVRQTNSQAAAPGQNPSGSPNPAPAASASALTAPQAPSSPPRSAFPKHHHHNHQMDLGMLSHDPHPVAGADGGRDGIISMGRARHDRHVAAGVERDLGLGSSVASLPALRLSEAADLQRRGFALVGGEPGSAAWSPGTDSVPTTADVGGVPTTADVGGYEGEPTFTNSNRPSAFLARQTPHLDPNRNNNDNPDPNPNPSLDPRRSPTRARLRLLSDIYGSGIGEDPNPDPNPNHTALQGRPGPSLNPSLNPNPLPRWKPSVTAKSARQLESMAEQKAMLVCPKEYTHSHT